MGAIRILLELTRADRPEDPYAFGFDAEDYLLRTQDGGFRSATFAWDEDFLADLDALRTPGCDPEIVQRIGERLHRFVAQADFGPCESTIVAAVERGDTVHMTIRSSAAEMYMLPWELLVIGASGRHLGELPGVSIRYAWPETHSVAAEEPRPEGGRILFAWSAASGAVPAAEHQQALERACQSGHHPFDPDTDILPHASPERLVAAFAEAERQGRPIAILHMLCHGAKVGQSFGLALDREPDSSGGARTGEASVVVDAGRMRQLLAPYARTLRSVVLCACNSGNIGQDSLHLGSVAQTLHRAGIQTVIAPRFPLSVHGSARFTDTFYGQLLGQPNSLEQAFERSRRALAEDVTNLDWAGMQVYARPEDGDDTRPVVFRPYRGLLPFRAEHTRFFHGRDSERSEVLADLDALVQAGKPRFLVVAGASGTGKSSMVMAGALPDLIGKREEAAGAGNLPVDRIHRDLDLLHGLASNDRIRQGIELLRGGLAELEALSAAEWEVAVMRIGTDPMHTLDWLLAHRSDPTRPYLLVVDQFEEIFTELDDNTIRHNFARRLWALSREDTNVHCLLTIRVDFLGDCGEIVLDETGLRLDQVAYDEAHRVFVAQMGPDKLRAAIEEPARQVGLQLEEGLASTMLAEVDGEPGALPLLQYTLDLLWQRRSGRYLTTKAYHELGGVTGALQRKADALIDSFDREQQKQARRLLVRLVGYEDDFSLDTRRRLPIETAQPSGESERAAFDKVLDAFVRERLLVRGDDGGTPSIEVAHEALIRKWERLRTWLYEDRDKLSEVQELDDWAVQWKDYGTLLEGQRLGYALRVRDKYPDDIDAVVDQMIDASEHSEREQRRRWRRRLRMSLVASLAVAAIMTGLGWWAFSEQRKVARVNAELTDKKQAIEDKNEALSQALALAEEKTRLEREARAFAEAEQKKAEDATAAEAAARLEAEEQKRIAFDALGEKKKAKLLAQAEAASAKRARVERKRMAAAKLAAERESQEVKKNVEKTVESAKIAAAEAAKKKKDEERAKNLEKVMGGSMIRDLPPAPKPKSTGGGQ